MNCRSIALVAAHRKDFIEHILAALDEQIAKVEREIRKHFDDRRDLKRRRDLLTPMPGSVACGKGCPYNALLHPLLHDN